ncbi:hypothetical protein ACFOS0_07715 [Nocardia seriolae]|uniref:Secreted protein n=1 Tax=Nocardia seriolae TaxID=37332 RepID=A0ABC9Z2A6_9NOCA|nr:hypothetical protein [Nocardia seriolae]MTJ86418.1 hypothetical protein [Nocardia seriolae]MTK46982.1 hypothetical protein [Nocardia seriolae]MTL12006.1 hypothetical protein [Nocardia seriolae]BEK85783.1 hypothetical protein NSERKGN1266_17340 [Nocardia seriolae]BEK98393.1 hypothetical protein NSER024013_62990 [Nocardia seriolae]
MAGAVTLASLVAPGFATAASVNAIDASHAPRSALSKWVRVPVTYACTADSAITQVTVSVNGQTQRRLSDQTQRGRNSSNPKKWMPVQGAGTTRAVCDSQTHTTTITVSTSGALPRKFGSGTDKIRVTASLRKANGDQVANYPTVRPLPWSGSAGSL